MWSIKQRLTVWTALTRIGLSVERPDAKEQAPDVFSDDDSTRDWLEKHSTYQTSKLSSYKKLKALGALYDGYISDDDIDGMIQIIQATKMSGDTWVADKFFSEDRLNGMWSLGQRTQIRVALANIGLSIR
jgi:hypothetical protein